MSFRPRHVRQLPGHRLLLLVAMSVIACATEHSEPTSPPPPPPIGLPVSLAVSPSQLSLLVGGVWQLTARAYDAAGRTVPSSFSWSSADPAVATVSSNGEVIAISPGRTTVTATVGSLTAAASVVVTLPSYLTGTIAFTRGSQSATGAVTFDVVLYSLTDGIQRSLPRPAEFSSVRAPAWSKDGAWLAVEVFDSILAVHEDFGIDYSSDIYVLRADAPTEPWRALTRNGRSRSPTWSPDGSRIAYLGGSRRFGDEQVYLVDVNTGESRRLTPTAGHYSTPRWSPDGTRLVFSNGLVGNGDVFIVNADGSDLELTNVTQHPAIDGAPSWSPDGSGLAFVSDREQPWHHLEVFVVELVDLGNPMRVAGDGWNWGPVWSPDGQHLAFEDSGPERQGIFVVSLHGFSPRPVRLTTAPLNGWDFAVAWRP